MSDRQAVTLAPGYMLHARPFRDSSVIADFFTQDYGRISLVARGARRPKSKLKGQLRPFQRCLVSWVTRSSLGTLTALETGNSRPGNIPRRVLSAYYVNELVMRSLRPGDSQAEVFLRYEQFLEELDKQDEAVVLRLFERDLLEYLGYGLQLYQTQAGRDIEPEAYYSFDVTEGASVASEGAGAIPGSSLLALARGHFDSPRSLGDAKRLLRGALDTHLGAADSKVRQVLMSMQAHKKEWHRDGDETRSEKQE